MLKPVRRCQTSIVLSYWHSTDIPWLPPQMAVILAKSGILNLNVFKSHGRRTPDYPFRGQIRISRFWTFGVRTHFTHFQTFDVWMGNLGWLFSGILVSRSMFWAKFGTKFTSKAPNYVKNFSWTPVVSGWWSNIWLSEGQFVWMVSKPLGPSGSLGVQMVIWHP